MIFRKMEKSDYPEMCALFSEMGEESTFFFNRDKYNETLAMSFFEKELPCKEFFVAEDDGKIAGYCYLWDTDKKIPWFGILVRETFKGKKVGTFLLNSTLELLKNRGFGGLLLTTHKKNIPGQALYEKCGFEKLGEHIGGEFLYLNRF